MAGKQNLEHLSTPRGQTQLALFANAARSRQQLPLAATVVVLAKSNIRIV
jgi:hypothetical protein